jgi:hypothetical protein
VQKTIYTGKKKEKIMFLLIIFWIVAIISEGYVLSVLWGWFMVPTLGLPGISLVQAIGISLIFALLTHRVQKEDFEEFIDENPELDEKEVKVIAILGQILVILFLACVVQFFM